MSKIYERRPNTLCLTCHTPVYRRPLEIQKGRVFCSSACFGKSNRKETPCVVCKASILAGKNKKTCSRRCSNKNRTGTTYRTGRKKDKVIDQRAVKLRLIEARGTKCERCSYGKVEILHVHHRDRDRSNNSLSNLELICPNCHYEEHYLHKSWLKGSLGS